MKNSENFNWRDLHYVNTWANQLCQGLGFYKNMAAHTMAAGLEGAREGL